MTIKELRARNAARSREWRRLHPGDPRNGKRSEYTKRYRLTESYRMAQQKYRRSKKKKLTNAIYLRKERAEHPEKLRARDAVKIAIANGKLKRSQICERCGAKTKTQGHHKNYLERLNVEWLCVDCHTSEHKKNATPDRN